MNKKMRKSIEKSIKEKKPLTINQTAAILNNIGDNYKKLYLTVSKEWLLENHPKMTLKEMYDNNIIQDKPFKEETGEPKEINTSNVHENMNKEELQDFWEQCYSHTQNNTEYN